MKKGINKIMSVVSIILCITLLSSISTQVLAETIGKNSDETPSNPNSHLRYFKGFNNCYILL